MTQGAYPAFERDGLVFAYMGPSESVPPFPESDAFEKYDDTRLVAFSNVFPCNWLQVLENIADQMHTAILHQPATLYDGALPPGIDPTPLTLPSFETMPLIEYVGGARRDRDGFYRRTANERSTRLVADQRMCPTEAHSPRLHV